MVLKKVSRPTLARALPPTTQKLPPPLKSQINVTTTMRRKHHPQQPKNYHHHQNPKSTSPPLRRKHQKNNSPKIFAFYGQVQNLYLFASCFYSRKATVWFCRGFCTAGGARGCSAKSSSRWSIAPALDIAVHKEELEENQIIE